MTSSSSASVLTPSAGARRYFQQFLGETATLEDIEPSIIAAIEPLDKEALAELGEKTYQAMRRLKSNADETAELLPDLPPLNLPQLQTAFYIALVGLIARELDIEPPAEVRAERGLSVSETLPSLMHDHLVLVARFSLDGMKAQRSPNTFSVVSDLIVERLSSLVELASQAMMGADVDPFETFDYKDCEKCGHLLQCHVGFETWNEVQGEHDQWCPGARSQ
jgi:hypothetical protein